MSSLGPFVSTPQKYRACDDRCPRLLILGFAINGAQLEFEVEYRDGGGGFQALLDTLAFMMEYRLADRLLIPRADRLSCRAWRAVPLQRQYLGWESARDL